MEFISTNRGGVKLCFRGYMYTKKAEKSNRIRWECSIRKSRECNGAVTTDLGHGDLHEVKGHNHDPQPHNVNVQKKKIEMKEKATRTRETPGEILASALQAADEPVRARLGRVESLKRTIRRQRSHDRPGEPAHLREVNIAAEWQTTGGENPQPFLFHDSGPDYNDHRVIAFGTDTALRHLASTQRWFMDGNFALAPNQFLQLYVIRAPLGETAVSCVYALLSKKTQECYQELFQAVLERCEVLGITPDPTNVITDFELSAMQAVHQVLGMHVTTQGCFFHLTQSTWRKIQSLGLTDMYKTNDEARLFCGMIDALAFLPLEDIPDGIAYLRGHTPEGLEDLLHYFDVTYVSGIARRMPVPQNDDVDGVPPQPRIRRTPPLFPPAVWNVNDLTLAGEDRTNNLCEAWNLGFSKLVGHHHPSLWTLIDCLRKDSCLAHTYILQSAAGQPVHKRIKRSTKDLQERLHRICASRRDGGRTVEQTLRAAGHTIRWI